MPRIEDTDGMQGAGTIILVDQLQDLGINAGDINKLKAAGIYSVFVRKEPTIFNQLEWIDTNIADLHGNRFLQLSYSFATDIDGDHKEKLVKNKRVE